MQQKEKAGKPRRKMLIAKLNMVDQAMVKAASKEAEVDFSRLHILVTNLRYFEPALLIMHSDPDGGKKT